MTSITLDSAAVSAFAALRDHAQVLDPSGQVIGVFLPTTPTDILKILNSPHTHEELERRAQTWEGKPLSEILERLNREYPAN